jgi:pimeloyl-ACP methyl ester carboxylesterase
VAQDRAVRERNSATGLAASLRLLGQGALPAVDVSRLVMPLLVISGGDDEPYVRGGAAMAAAAPRGEAAVVPGCGHGVVGEDPDAVARLAAKFLPRSW